MLKHGLGQPVTCVPAAPADACPSLVRRHRRHGYARRVATILGALLIGVVSGSAAAATEEEAWTVPFQRAEPAASSRIVDGRVAPGGSFPMVLQLLLREAANGRPAARDSTVCAATLIAPQWALTAAHCLVTTEEDDNPPPGRRRAYEPLPSRAIALRAGTVVLGSGGQRLAIERFIIHEEYAPETRNAGPRHDIALIRLASPLDLPTTPLLGASLAEQLLAPSRGAATVVGWGRTRWEGPRPEQLLQVDIDLLPRRVCRFAHPDMPGTAVTFCAGVLDRCTTDGLCPDACQGDSGGPLFVRDGVGLLQAGIVSYNRECGRRGYPAVYTSVAAYEGWIRRHVQEASVWTRPPPAFEQTSAELTRPPSTLPPALRPAVSISMPAGPTVQLGGDIVLRLVSNVPGRLLIFNENAEGSGYLVFPNLVSRQFGRGDERIAAGQPVLLPDPNRQAFVFQAAPPGGRNRMVAVVIPSDAPVDPVIDPQIAQARIPRLDDWVRELTARLPQGRIASGEVTYEIRP